MKNKSLTKDLFRLLSHSFTATLLMGSISANVASAQDIFAEENEGLLHKSVLYGNLGTLNDPYGEAKLEQPKFAVKLKVFEQNGAAKGICTGIIVAKDLVLTSGHCFRQDGLKVEVHFGVGDQAMPIVSTKYRWIAQPAGSGPSPWKNGKLEYDAQQLAQFQSELLQQTELKNYFGSNDTSYEHLSDLALIKIDSIPKGYGRIEMISGETKLRETVRVIGYGTNSRTETELDWKLRWSDTILIGHYTRPNEVTTGWRIYSPTGNNFCFGDSGGPAVVKVGKTFKLLGVIKSAYNSCANGGWVVDPRHFESFIKEATAALRAKEI